MDKEKKLIEILIKVSELNMSIETAEKQILRLFNAGSHSIAVEWWNNLPTTDRFRLLQENGYQDQRKPWKYRPLTDKGIYLIWCRQNGC